MNLDAIKKKLDELNNSEQGNVNNSDKFWTVPFGKSQVRIVPSMYNPDNPFTELKFHNKLAKYPILALSNFGEQDPVEDLIEKLRETGDKENWSLSGKLTPRPRYFVPVIVRGEEDKGVRIWSIGVTTYKALLTLAADEEIGDYTDITNGTDMVVEKVKKDPFPEITIRAKRTSSPLSENKEELEKWLKDQPDPAELFRKPDYNYIKKKLKEYLDPSTATESTEKVEAKVDEDVKKVAPKEETPAELKLNTTTAPATKKAVQKSKASKFDDLFGDDSSMDTPDDELPFN